MHRVPVEVFGLRAFGQGVNWRLRMDHQSFHGQPNSFLQDKIMRLSSRLPGFNFGAAGARRGQIFASIFHTTPVLKSGGSGEGGFPLSDTSSAASVFVLQFSLRLVVAAPFCLAHPCHFNA